MLVTVDHTDATNAIRDALAAELAALGIVVAADRLAELARNVALAVVALDGDPR